MAATTKITSSQMNEIMRMTSYKGVKQQTISKFVFLLWCMMNYDPENRPTLDEVLNWVGIFLKEIDAKNYYASFPE